MFRKWLAALAVCSAVIVFFVYCCDRAVADAVHRFGTLPDAFHNRLVHVPILQGMGVGCLFWGALATGRESGRQAITALHAGIAMVCAMAINITLLKPAFGRAVPWLYVARGGYGFHPFVKSSLFASFPSGHAALAGALVCILWMEYPKGRLAYVAATAILFCALILGEWHYVSDLIAGSFVGVTVAMAVTAVTAGLEKRRLAPMPDFPGLDVTQWFDWIMGADDLHRHRENVRRTGFRR